VRISSEGLTAAGSSLVRKWVPSRTSRTACTKWGRTQSGSAILLAASGASSRWVTGLPEGANAGPCQPGRYSGSSRRVLGVSSRSSIEMIPRSSSTATSPSSTISRARQARAEAPFIRTLLLNSRRQTAHSLRLLLQLSEQGLFGRGFVVTGGRVVVEAVISALPFTNMRGGLEQEFSADRKRHRRDHDFSVQSVAAFGAVIKCEFI
jgi:hypothetical protein